MADTTACIRCGKPRIVAKSWSENINGSLITYTLTVCPDDSCQKIVESQLKKKRDKMMVIQRRSLERRKALSRTRKLKSKGKL